MFFNVSYHIKAVGGDTYRKQEKLKQSWSIGPDTISRASSSVGGEIKKRLVAMAEQQLAVDWLIKRHNGLQ